MTVRLYMDEHVPRAITAGLRRRGGDVVTAQDNGRRHTPDPEVLDRAKVSIGDCVRDLGILAQASELEEWVNRVECLPL